MNNLQKNIFLQKSKDKFNPDIISKKNLLENERKNNIIKKNNLIYNSITNIVPTEIKSYKDLELQKDIPICNFENLLAEKNKERIDQEVSNKSIKQKVIVSNINNEKIQTYNELKSEQINLLNLKNKETENNKNNYDNIIDNLKKLGILNN
jgi:hypothetical protein